MATAGWEGKDDIRLWFMPQTVAYDMPWEGHDSEHQKIQNAFFVGTVAQRKEKNPQTWMWQRF